MNALLASQSFGVQPIPLNDILSHRCEVHPEIENILDADVIFGEDPIREHSFVVYGHDRLKEFATGDGTDLIEMKVVVVSLLQRTTDLERFIALINHVKGSNDYHRVSANPI